MITPVMARISAVLPVPHRAIYAQKEKTWLLRFS